MTDKQPMQADGSGTSGNTGANPGTTGAGESGGGAYEGPQSDGSAQGATGHGGQTKIFQKIPGDKDATADHLIGPDADS